MNKRGQFFLIAAVVIAGILIGLGAVYVSLSSQKEDRIVYDLTKEISYEASRVIDKGELGAFKKELQEFQGSFKTLGWMRVVPWVSGYYRDGDAGIKAGLYGIDAADLLIETAEPYA